jgi:hypothetical protein
MLLECDQECREMIGLGLLLESGIGGVATGECVRGEMGFATANGYEMPL